jgi:hypothetical protein
LQTHRRTSSGGAFAVFQLLSAWSVCRPEGQEGFGIAVAADGAYTRRSDAVRTAEAAGAFFMVGPDRNRPAASPRALRPYGQPRHLMALFGYPITLENHAERTALAIPYFPSATVNDRLINAT